MKRAIVVRPRARGDLAEIWTYTLRHWGTAQADAYLSELNHAFRSIAQQPDLGSDRGHVRAGLRKVTVKAHAIYYFTEDTCVRISRVLHVRRDPDRNL